MKGFIQFLAGVLVIAVILVTVKFLVTSKVEVPEVVLPSGDVAQSGEIEKSGEIIRPELNVEEAIKDIDNLAIKLDAGELQSTNESGISVEVGGAGVAELLTIFEVSGDTLPGKTEVRNNRVELIFVSDFIENQIFYYDEEGDLVLYKTVSSTVGGEVRYYFVKGESIKVVFDYAELEANEQATPDNVQDILARSIIIYNKYLKK